MANNLKNKVTLKVRLFRRLSEVLLRRFVLLLLKALCLLPLLSANVG